MKFVLTFLIVVSMVRLPAQQSSGPMRGAVKTDLVAYLPGFKLNTGKANVELEVPVGACSSMGFNSAYILSYGPTSPAGFNFTGSIEQAGTQGFMAGAGYRRYFGRTKVFEPLCLLIWPLVFQLNGEKTEYAGLYVSGQLAYQHTWTLVDRSNREPIRVPYNVSRGCPLALVKIGFQSISPRRVVVDQSFGLGVQYPFASATPSAEFDKYFISLQSTSRNPGIYPLISYSLKVGLAY